MKIETGIKRIMELKRKAHKIMSQLEQEHPELNTKQDSVCGWSLSMWLFHDMIHSTDEALEKYKELK